MKDIERIIKINNENCAYINFLYNSETRVKKTSNEEIKIHRKINKQFIDEILNIRKQFYEFI